MTRKDDVRWPGQYIRLEGKYSIRAKYPDGKVKVLKGKNLITTAGETLVAALLDFNGSETAPSYIAFGTGSEAPLKSDTQLQSEQSGTRTVADSSSQVNNVVELTWADLDAGASYTIAEMGIFNDSVTGTMISRFLTQALPVASGVLLDITWALTISGVD